jgi:hypothetical protein
MRALRTLKARVLVQWWYHQAPAYGLKIILPSHYHLICPSPSSMCEAHQEPNVYGSITYSAFGYGGMVMPDHAYLLITNQTQPAIHYETG